MRNVQKVEEARQAYKDRVAYQVATYKATKEARKAGDKEMLR